MSNEKNINDVKAWVTGAGGFIGSHLVDFLLEKKMRVIASIEPGKNLRNLNHLVKEGVSTNPLLTLIECDLRDQRKIEEIIVEFKPNVIFHLAAQSTVRRSWEDPAYTIQVNMIGEIYIFEAIKKHKLNTKVVVACSSAEYGEQSKEELPLKETNHLRPLHPYGISKVGQEFLARQYWVNFKIPSVILRFFNQTGPRKDNDACSEFGRKIAKIESGKMEPIIEVGNLETYRDIMGIKDTIQSLWLAYTKGKAGETYNVCSGKATKIKDVLDYFISLSSKKIEVKSNVPKLLRIIDEPIILGDNSKIKKELGFEIKQDLYDCLKDIFEYWIEYYKNHDD
ncbi:MAG: GDP-mannose 4,6-dehydratase [Promethearchaeota archaeon]